MMSHIAQVYCEGAWSEQKRLDMDDATGVDGVRMYIAGAEGRCR